jgi:hypothetical protein
VVLASVCPAAESIALYNGATVTGTFPVNPAFTTVGDIRMEFRLHGFTQPADYYGWMFYFGNFLVRFLGPSEILNISDNYDNYTSINVDLAGRSDVVVRFQRDKANTRLSLEVWNADGTGYAYALRQMAGVATANIAGTPITFGAATTTTDLAYLRLYSSVLPLGSQPPSRTDGNLADWEFEGNLNDKSGHGVNLAGSAAMVATPALPIGVSIGGSGAQRVWSANHGSILLDATNTYSSVDDPAYTFTWSQISGPGTGAFSASNGSVTSFSAFVAGDYKIRLTAGDGTTTGFVDFDAGAVNTDERGIVQTGNAAMDIALGPLSMWGTSPWPWYDLTEMADADALYPMVTSAPIYGQVALSGTVSAVNGSPTITGTGTNFIKDLTDCDPSSGSGSAFTCTSNAPYANLTDIQLRDRYFVPDVNCSGSPTLNVNSTITLPVYYAGTSVPAGCTAHVVYEIYLQGCLTAGGATCGAGFPWAAGNWYTAGMTVLDSSYHVQRALGYGSSGSSLPAWNDSGGTTIDGGNTWQDEGLAFYTLGAGNPLLWLWWNGPDGQGSGRFLVQVSTIDSPTSLTIQRYGGYWGPTAESTNIQYSSPSLPELGIYWNYTSQPSNNLNYYDVVHALYKLYYRTNLTKYLTEARTLADNWYKYATSQGYDNLGAPRAMGFLGMIDRAIDGRPSIWKTLDVYYSYPWTMTDFQLTTPQGVGFGFDTRETGYEVRDLARMAALDPDPGWHSTACSYLHNVVTNVYASSQDSLGQWEVDLYSENPTYPGARLGNRFGSSPWRDAMTGLALEESYDILQNNCGDSVAASVALSTVTKEADFTHDYGQGTSFTGSGVGQFANVMYGSMTSTNILSYSTSGNQFPTTTGTLGVTAGSTTVVGTGTNFKAVFSAIYKGTTLQTGVDPQFIGVPGIPFGSCNVAIPVQSVIDDTHLTLATSWPCASASNVTVAGPGWVAAPAAATNCASYGSIATTCEGAPDPSLSHEVHAMWSWLYWKTGNSKYMTWALQSAGTDYGGSGGGPGSPLPPAGPYATGFTGNFLSALPPCGTSPCGGYGVSIALGKDFAFSAGAGNANNAMAYLILGTPVTPVLNRRFTGQTVVTGHTQ